MHQVTMYGIKNCDTIKKAKKWLEQHGIDYSFHDYRQDGLDSTWLKNAMDELGWELVLNKRGTTYRQLDQETKDNMNETIAHEVMLSQPAMIKRPILAVDNKLYIGFKADQYSEVFNK